jgi:hypothetical protein
MKMSRPTRRVGHPPNLGAGFGRLLADRPYRNDRQKDDNASCGKNLLLVPVELGQNLRGIRREIISTQKKTFRYGEARTDCDEYASGVRPVRSPMMVEPDAHDQKRGR